MAPSYEDITTDIEMVKLAIKLEEDCEARDKLQRELVFLEEYLDNMIDKGRTDGNEDSESAFY